jgi:NAD(P)-dependent dehydrogenase (short-subunit alcohol dehydrogenase family)
MEDTAVEGSGKVCRGKVALITGASRGIGRAAALRFAHAGADVALLARDADGERLGRSLSATVAEVREVGVRAIALTADLTDPTLSRRAIIAEAEAELGPVDILVNNAAMSVFRDVAEWAPAKVRRMFEVNVLAPWELAAAVLPGMLERDEGWIVNISTGVGEPTHARAGGAAYGGTKAMLDQFTRCLALETEGTGVVANVVSPQGASRTEFVDQLVQADTLGADLTEPVEAMAEAILALATAPRSVRGLVVRDLELLNELGRPVHDLTGTSVLEGYTAGDLADRISELSDSASNSRDLRGAWGTTWTSDNRSGEHT